MSKEAALLNFFESFGIEAYPVGSVPVDCKFPYLTYELITDDWMAGEVGLTVNLWYYTTSESEPNAKAREIGDKIGYGGLPIECDGGFLWIKKGHPWCQSVQEDDENIKRRYMNVTVEYMTET